MSEISIPAEGGCRCGKVRFKVTAPPLMTLACHCTGCQHMSASAFSLTMIVPSEAFEVSEGETALGGIQGKTADHHFCAFCKSWMFTRAPGFDQIVNVRPTLLDDPSGFEVFAETYRSEALPWAKTTAVHSYAAFPPMEDFGRLMAEYAKSQGREPPALG